MSRAGEDRRGRAGRDWGRARTDNQFDTV